MHRKRFMRAVALTAAVCIILTTGAFADVLGTKIMGYQSLLGAGMELAKGVYWTGSDYQCENYITYSPNTTVHPAVVSGSKVCNYGNFGSMANLLEKQGEHVVAGMNGDYFVVATNMPLGIVIQNGELLSSDEGHYGIGFNSDGTVLYGLPAINVGVTIDGSAFTFNSLNKNRQDGEAVVYTDAYAYKTNNTGDGTDVVCSLSGTVTPNCKLTLTVENVITTGGSVSIPDGQVILSVSADASDALKAAVAGLKAGSTVTLGISCASGWDKVSCAVGSLYKLITNGQLDGSIPDSDSELAPRTAVGRKSDGSILFYTIDGRQSGESVGITIKTLAQRLLEMGCVEASILDGGSSTTINAIYPGDSAASQVNSPSDGFQRSVSDYIMLVTEAKATGTAKNLQLYPLMTNMLLGANSQFLLKASDENGYAASINTDFSLAATNNLGTIDKTGIFKATTSGAGYITAAASGLTGASVPVNVVATPDTITVSDESSGTKVNAISTEAGAATSLTASATSNHLSLISQDSCYTWAADADIGTISPDGTFTATDSFTPGEKSVTGNIAVTAGGKSVYIPVTVTNPVPYTDVTKDAWYYDAVKYVFNNKVMTGTSESAFSPDSTMTRAMAVTVLYRMAGSPEVTATEDFKDVTKDKWFCGAVSWAESKGIVKGADGKFSPDVSITREQLAAILYRYSGSPATSTALSAYKDASKVSSWAKDALSWTVGKKLMSGVTADTLSPEMTATRAQMATILVRLAG